MSRYADVDVLMQSIRHKLGIASLDNLLESEKAIVKEIDSAPSIVPSADRPQGEWIEKAISIIDDMQSEGIVDYEQAREFRMRARMKGAYDE